MESARVQKYLLETALTDAGWKSDVVVTIADGRFQSVEPGAQDPYAERVSGSAVPGLGNVHSRAIERGLAGVAERHSGPGLAMSETLARFSGALTPDDVEAIAALAHMEMLEAGFTAVGEFQTLHLGPDGRPYTDIAEVSSRVVAAAEQAGIALTLLPVLQTHGGFGPRQADPTQRRMVHDLGAFRDLMKSTRVAAAFYPGTVLGVGIRSLRTSTIGDIRDLTAEFPGVPIHIRVAGDDSEVAECLSIVGVRPVDYLLDWVPVDTRWCLMHAIHANSEERVRLAHCGATVGVCPVSEATRGDGLFDAAGHVDAGGRLGIGSETNVRVSPAELLRWLETGQRQRHHRRAGIVVQGATAGRGLFDFARRGGAQALGRPIPAIAAGAPADLVVLDTLHPAFAGRSGDRLLDAWIFVADADAVREVWVGGRQLVKDGRHKDRARIVRRFRTVMERLAGVL